MKTTVTIAIAMILAVGCTVAVPAAWWGSVPASDPAPAPAPIDEPEWYCDTQSIHPELDDQSCEPEPLRWRRIGGEWVQVPAAEYPVAPPPTPVTYPTTGT